MVSKLRDANRSPIHHIHVNTLFSKKTKTIHLSQILLLLFSSCLFLLPSAYKYISTLRLKILILHRNLPAHRHNFAVQVNILVIITDKLNAHSIKSFNLFCWFRIVLSQNSPLKLSHIYYSSSHVSLIRSFFMIGSSLSSLYIYNG